MFLYETTIDEPGIQQKRKPLMALVETYIVTGLKKMTKYEFKKKILRFLDKFLQIKNSQTKKFVSIFAENMR